MINLSSPCYRVCMNAGLTISGLTLGLCGCMSAPNVQVGEVAPITAQTLDATAAMVPVRVSNPNARSIKLVEYRYTVRDSDGSKWVGRHAGGTVLSPGFDRTAELPIVLPAGTGPGSDISISGSLRYLDTSTIAETLSEWGWRPDAGFSGPVELVELISPPGS